MKLVNVHTPLIDVYLKLFAMLNQESKQVLYERFSEVLQQEKAKELQFFSLFGALKNEKSAEEMINEIRDARLFNREIESL